MMLICASAAGQRYSVGHTTAELRDPARGNRRVSFEVYYPVSEGTAVFGKTQDTSAAAVPVKEKGSNAAVSDPEVGCTADVSEQEGLTARFPVICFAHGYQHPGDKYGNLANILVPAGYIMLSLTTYAGPFPSHRGYAKEVRFLASAIGRMGSDPDSPLFGIADTLCCLMGHSLGGGAVFHAAADNPHADAVIALTPYDAKPSALVAAGSVVCPTLIFSGTSDCITPPEKHHLPLYERSSADDKTYISIINGSHCGMGALRKCFTAEKLAGCTGGLGTEEQTAILARYIIPWLDCFLKGDRPQGRLFNQRLESDEAVTWLHSRPLPVMDYPTRP